MPRHVPINLSALRARTLRSELTLRLRGELQPVGAAGYADAEELAHSAVVSLRARTIASAESCTAGRIAQSLASVERADEFFRGGVVTYQEDVKRRLLGVTSPSVLTLECAKQMAVGAARLFDADVTVATTGSAGGAPVEGTDPGTVYIAVWIGGLVTATEYRFTGDPPDICDQACRQALADVAAALRTRDELLAS